MMIGEKNVKIDDDWNSMDRDKEESEKADLEAIDERRRQRMEEWSEQ